MRRRGVFLTVLLAATLVSGFWGSFAFLTLLAVFVVAALITAPKKELPPGEQLRALELEEAQVDRVLQQEDEELQERFAKLQKKEKEEEEAKARQAQIPPSQGEVVRKERSLRGKIRSVKLEGNMTVRIRCWSNLPRRFEVSARENLHPSISAEIKDEKLTVRGRLGVAESAVIFLDLPMLTKLTVGGRVVAEIHREKQSPFILFALEQGKVKLTGEGTSLEVVGIGNSIVDVSGYSRSEIDIQRSDLCLMTT